MITLEKFTESDFEMLIGWVDNERLMHIFAGPIFTYPIDKVQLKKYISDKRRRVFKVRNTKTSEIIGHCEINKIDLKNMNARICRMLIASKNNRNKGYCKLIINNLLKIGFLDLKLHRIDLGVFDFNKSAIKCYKNCGFSIEGLFRDCHIIENKYESMYNMSILKSEWIK
jgi:RimJ/RimL family protein N-acetyltransferase